jgi:hypothetical protein
MPNNNSLLNFLHQLNSRGVVLRHVVADVQRIVKVGREVNPNGVKSAKMVYTTVVPSRPHCLVA